MITDLKINDIPKPLGFRIKDYVKVSWQVDDTLLSGSKQIAGQVLLARDSDMTSIVFDTGKDERIKDNNYYLHFEFAARTRYYVQVRIWTDADEELLSEVSWFETAKQDEAWSANWITSGKEEPVQFIKDFQVNKPISCARLYILGLGVYEAYLNGKKIGEEYLSPGFHSYDLWLQYQTYETFPVLGRNRLQVYLGDGWYKGRIGFDGGYKNLYGDQRQLLAELIITYKDGTEEIIATDLSWETSLSPVSFSGIYDGEIFNANLIDIQETFPVELAKDLTDRLNSRLSLPITAHERFKPQLIRTPAGETVLDFGQNLSGWIEFDQALPQGTEVSYEVGELLQGGNFYRDNLRTAEAKFTYISDGQERIVRPHFTFYGFRYAKLTGFPESLDPEDFEAVALYSQLEETGDIETDNQAVNQLISNIKWGQKGNFLDVPTDCPQRDERLGWTGDAQIFARTASYLMYTPAFYQKFLEDLRREQGELDGSVPFMVPMLKPESQDGFVMGNGAAVWSDAATVIPWVLYEQYGDIKRLEDHYPIMKDWVDYIQRQDIQTGSKRLWTTNFQFGDWLSLDGKDPNSPMGGTDTVLVASVFYYYSTSLLVKAAQALGIREDIRHYQKLSDDIKRAIQEEFFTKRGRLAISTQTAHVLVLYFDLVPEEALSRTIEGLKKLLLESAVHLKTGFTGTPYMCEALSKYGLTEYAYTLLLNDDYPSWLYAVKLGATTVWERWNSVLEDGTISGTGMNSLNHYAYGSIAEWIYRVAAGIQSDPERVGFKHFYLKPQPSWQLKHIKARYQSINGLIVSESNLLADGQLEFKFRVPFNTTATIVLPHAPEELLYQYPEARQEGNQMLLTVPAGEYAFHYQPTIAYKPTYSVKQPFESLAVPVATSQIIYKHIPFLKKNDMVLSFLDLPLEQFDRVPIINRMVNQDVIESIQNELEQLNQP